jgi:hypothetical protein
MALLMMLPIFGLSAFFYDRLKLKIEFTFFLAVSAISSLLYVGALAGALYLTAVAILLLGVAIFFYYVYVEFIQKGYITFFRTTEFLSFLALVLVLFVLLSQTYFKEWDEFSHWGLFDKYLAITHHLAHSGGVILFPYYPPAQNLFHYFFVFLGDFSEQISYFANAIILSSGLFCFTSLIKNDTSNKATKIVLVFLIFAIGLELIYKNAWHWLYADHTLAVVFAASMLISYELRNSERLYVYLAFPVFFMTLIKPYAFIFSGTIFMTLIFFYFSSSRDKKYLKSAATVFFAISVAYVSWMLYLKYGTNLQNQTFNIVLDGLRHSFAGDRGERDIATLQAFVLFLLKKASIIFIALGILIFAATRFYKDDKALKNIIYAFFVGLFIFLSFLLLSYLYLFGDFEGPKLASIERYSPSYVFSLTALLLYLLLKKLFEKHIDIRLLFGCIAITILFFGYKTYNELAKENLADFRRDAASMDIGILAVKSIIKKDSKICVISGHFWFDKLYFNYKFLPDMRSYVNITDKGESKINLDEKTIERILLEYDYVIVHDVPSDFFEIYSAIFCVKNKNPNFVLYTKDKNSNGKLHIEYEN